MNLEKIPRDSKDPFQGYIVVNITPDEIPPADKDFLDLIRQIGGLSFINTFTIREFNKQMRERFSSRGHKEADTRCGPR